MRRLILTLCVIALGAGCSEKKVDGPTPVVTDAVKRDAADLNPRIMWHATATPVTVTGDKFVPMAGDTFLDKVFARVPKLYLVNATSSTLLDSIVWVDRQTMLAEIPAGIEIADAKGFEDFQIVAVDPSGKRGEPGGSFRVSTFETPELTGAVIGGAAAVARFCDTATASTDPFDLTVQGKFFIDGAKIEYGLAITGAEPAWAPATVTGVTAGALVATIPAGLEAGEYSIRITNVDGQIAIIERVFTVEFYACPTFSILGVTPKFAYRGENVMLQLDGEGFEPIPALTLTRSGFAVNVSYETWLTDTTVQGLLYKDAARPVGWYDLSATNPESGNTAELAGAVLVVDQPLPKITTVSPDTLPGVDVFATIIGENLCDATCAAPADTTVGVYSATGFLAGVTSQTLSTSRIVAFIPGGTGGVYVLRVTRNIVVNGVTEKIYTDYSNIVVTANPSGNTDPFQRSTSKLVTPRREFGLVGTRNAIGTRFLYAIAGRSSNVDTAMALATVDIAPIDVFGKLLPFYQSPVTLGVAPRYGAGLVEFGGWVYLIGGSTSAAGPVNEVLKAKVLDPASAPELVSVAEVSGALAVGSWIYRVSAVLPNSSTVNPGETLPSVEGSITLAAAGGVKLVWKPIAGATSYRVYRTDAPGALPLTEHRIAEVTSVAASCAATCTYTDSGAAAGTLPFLPDGALSAWAAAGTLNAARSQHVVAVARNRFGAPFIYALGGISTTGGVPLSSYEYASVTTGGDLTFATGGGAMSIGRRDAMVAIGKLPDLTAAQITSATLTSDWVSVMSGAGTTFGAISTSADNAQVQDNGALGGFSNYSKTLSGVAGGGAIIAAETLFHMGGTNSAYDGTGSQDTVASGLFTTFKTNPTPQLALQSFNANPNGLLSPRSFFGYTRFNAQIFIVGGAMIDPQAGLVVTDTVESVFY